MNIDGKHFRTIWPNPDDPATIKIIDQTKLPFSFEILDLNTLKDAETAITSMQVRGAGLIGATAGFGMYLAAHEANQSNVHVFLKDAADRLMQTRPTAVNLQWAVKQQLDTVKKCKTKDACIKATYTKALEIADGDALMCKTAISFNGSVPTSVAAKDLPLNNVTWISSASLITWLFVRTWP